MADLPTSAETHLDSDSETESFVDAMEELELQKIKDVEFASNSGLKLSGEDTPDTNSCEQSEEEKSSNHETHSKHPDSPKEFLETDSNGLKNKNRTCDLELTEDSSQSSDTESESAAAEEAVDELIKSVEEDTSEVSAEEGADVGQEDQEKQADFIDEEDMKEREALMTEEEKQIRREEAQALKTEGNQRFRDSNYQGALESYTEALMASPLCYEKERSVMYSNRAACKLKMERHDSAIEDCTKALELNPYYLKPLLRRAELNEKVDKLEDALADYQKALELDSSLVHARLACMKLPDQIKERNEKMKAEMIGKLKDLGNMVLRPFGLSTENFNLQQDPTSGSYSVQFQQNAPPQPTNGK